MLDKEDRSMNDTTVCRCRWKYAGGFVLFRTNEAAHVEQSG
jgi:hypothetical protein